MLKENKKIKYILYARKSTESEDRQVQSIDDQINKLTELAKRFNLDIVEIIKESKSAKMPYARPLFNKMIEKIEKGKANGILCWKLDRLFRNPVDFGRVQWLHQGKTILSIQTYEREYKPEDNVILSYVESGMANQYILDLSKNVKRGQESKLLKGWFPNKPAIGYMNNPDISSEEAIISDPERYNLVRKMWDMMLTGNYSAAQILEIINEKWGFRTRKARKLGGKKLSRAAIYRMFTNLFYAGYIDWGGHTNVKGKHKPMISLEEYDHVQLLLGRSGKQRPKTRTFPFTGIIKCGECGCQITAITKTKLIKTTNKIKNYTYYHCTKRKKDYKCSQKEEIRAEELDRKIEIELEKISMMTEFRELILKKLKALKETESMDIKNIYETRLKTLASNEEQLDKLMDMKLNDQVSEEQYMRKRANLLAEIERLKELVKEAEEKIKNDDVEDLEKTFNFAMYAHYHFLNGDTETRKTIFTALGENFLLKDAILDYELKPWYIPIKEDYKDIEKEYLAWELDKSDHSTLSGARKKAFENVCLNLSDQWDLNPRPLPPQGSALPS